MLEAGCVVRLAARSARRSPYATPTPPYSLKHPSDFSDSRFFGLKIPARATPAPLCKAIFDRMSKIDESTLRPIGRTLWECSKHVRVVATGGNPWGPAGGTKPPPTPPYGGVVTENALLNSARRRNTHQSLAT